jgi:hypothetical protein
VAQAYRVLLTRALRGAFLWIPDDETRNYVEASLGIEDTNGDRTNPPPTR